MINTKYVRDHLDEIKKSLERRKSDYPIDELLSLDKQWRETSAQLQELQAQRNKASLEISQFKKEGKGTEDKIKALADVKEKISSMEKQVGSQQEKMDSLLWNMPNVLDASVPYGASEDENPVVKTWGTPDENANVPGHEETYKRMGLLDTEQAAVVSGARFAYLKGDLALLEQALIRFAVDTLVKKGYTLVAPPLMLKKEFYRGATALGDFEELLYKIADPKEADAKSDYEKMEAETFMISTSEHPLAALHAGQVLNAKDLPKKYIGISPCFRREAGSHGKDTKGIFRVHHFYKVEQFIFCKPEDSPKHFEELVANEEEIFQKLGMPYHVLNFCTGGIGTVAAKKNDIEVYMKAQKKFREVTSASNCTDWQSVRLDIKYEEKGEKRYVHTLNGTAIATTRVLVALAENCLNKEGKIELPDALVPYMGKKYIG